MARLKYTIIFILLLTACHSTQALDIEYGTVVSTKNNDILSVYSGIENKRNFICNVLTLKCSSTKKWTLGVAPKKTVPKKLQQELKEKNAGHVTLSPSNNLLAYYVGGTDEKPSRVFSIQDIKKEKEYSISSSISYWDLVDDEGRVFDFSPDSKQLVYLDDKSGDLALYLADVTKLTDAQMTSTKLSTSAYQISDFLFTDNQTLYYIGNTKENPYNWSLYRYNLKTRKDIALESNVSYVDSMRKVGNTIVFNRLQEKGYGPEIYNLKTKKINQLKVPGVNTTKKITNQEIIKLGDSMTGVLMTPTKDDVTKTYPLVVWLHGGPYRQTSYGFHPYHSYGGYDSFLELLRKNNVIVLKLDYRGSSGLGRAYAEGIKGSVGTGDVEDVMNAISYAKNRYHISDTYLMGNSYGGYLSLRTLVEHPNGLTGVVSINGVTDWESLLIKMQTSIFNTQFNGLPNETNKSLYYQASIASRISNIGNQKIAIIAGQADRTIPYWQATDLYTKLKSLNKNVNLVSYPGEDHVYKQKKTLSDLCNQIFNFVNIPTDKDCT